MSTISLNDRGEYVFRKRGPVPLWGWYTRADEIVNEHPRLSRRRKKRLKKELMATDAKIQRRGA